MRIVTAAAILLAALLSCPARAGEEEKAAASPQRQEWLVRHQDADGSWDPVRFDRHCEEPGPCSGPGLPGDRVGLTGLVLLDFLGYGETHRTQRYGDVVRKALRWFQDRQRDSGAFEPATGERFVLNHARATLALAELYALTQSPLVRGTARRAVDHLLSRRLKEGGWPAGAEGGETDLETSAWAAIAVKSAMSGGLEVGDAPWGGLRAWLDAGTDPETGRFGPVPERGSGTGGGAAPPPPETATAMALYARVFMAGREPDPAVAKGIALLLRRLPDAGPEGGDLDFRYVYFGTQVLFRAGGEAWMKWNEAMKRAVVDTQCLERTNCTYGSWDPTAASAVEGRVGCTALGILALQVYYRYSR